jgi:alpha/beta superfamily hydrolase
MNWRETPATLSRACDEQPAVFTGPKGALHGIFTPPAPDVPPARACVVFPGRPRSGLRHHLVLAARILAAEGFAVLRFDLRGRGEIAGEVERPSRTEPRGEDVVAAIRHLREAHGQKQFLLAGIATTR